ncbi:MAG: 30S ribosomal protein S9 [Candidatus Pacearchaeota archaeon]|nr:30S ribosomal protein S9 [Candidatus Pacearchaeota archaeon]
MIKKKQEKKEIVVGGIKKESVARATIREGTGIVKINKKPLELFNNFQRLSLSEPLVIAQDILKEKANSWNIDVSVRGGGVESQIDAARLAIARALVAFTKSSELKNAFLKYDRMLLVADTRRKEMRKPNDSKARAARQKSYR